MSSFRNQPSPAPASNEELARQARAGCLESFDLLVRRLSPALLQFLARRAPSVADAEDQCQEAFLRAFQNLDKYREKWRFATWLFTIARRCQLNTARRQSPPGSSDSINLVSGNEPEPVDALVAVESRLHLWSLAHRTLSQPQCDALWLFYVEEMSIQEVAHVLGRTRVGVRTLLYRARKKMHAALADEGDWHVAPFPSGELPVHTLGLSGGFSGGLSGGGYFHA